MNDGINRDEFSPHYIMVVIRMVSQFGKGALMAKFDVESAYRNIAIHPSDHFLLGIRRRSTFYVDLALPFGLLRPLIFSVVLPSWWNGNTSTSIRSPICYIIYTIL